MRRRARTKPHMAKGRYRISRKIADGGMAEIYAGTQHGVEGFERPVVLKRILPTLLVEPQFKNLMIDEAHVAMSLTHTNIVQVLDLGQAKGHYYLVLELVDGWDLNQILNRVKALPGFELSPTLALFIVGEVCRALAYAHSRTRGGKPMGIVHRDVSPHNVLVSAEGEVKLTDFGIAKAMTKRENTVQGVIKGKLAFMSPEQASGTVIDARSDLFSIGTLLYLMFTGKRPFEAPTDLESILRVQKADFPPPERINPRIAPEVAALIQRAMKLDPALRFQTADAMLEVIEDVQRQVFGASGKTELKRWLADLETRDHVPSIGRLPPPTRSPDDTMELGDQDIEFEDSTMGAVPEAVALGATLASSQSASRSGPPPAPGASAIPESIAFAPTGQASGTQRLSSQPPPLAPTPSSQRSSRRMFGTLGLLTSIGIAIGLLVRRDETSPPDVGGSEHGRANVPFVPTPAPQGVGLLGRAESYGDVDESEAPSASADAAAPDASPPGQAPAATPDQDPDQDESDNEESLLAQAEKDLADKVIGDDPEDAVLLPTRKAPPTPSKAGKPNAAPKPAPIVSVKVASRPSGAVVKLKRRVFGRAPMSLRFKAGITYELTFIKQGYLPAKKRFTVSARKNQSVSVALRKRPPPKKQKNFIQRMLGL